jgi:hypothetical protein
MAPLSGFRPQPRSLAADEARDCKIRTAHRFPWYPLAVVD